MYEQPFKEIMIHHNGNKCVREDKSQHAKKTKRHNNRTQDTQKAQLTEPKSPHKYLRVFPPLVVDLVLPRSSLSGTAVQHLGFIKHLMVKAQDALVLGKRSRRLSWSHWPELLKRRVATALLGSSPWWMLESEGSSGETKAQKNMKP